MADLSRLQLSEKSQEFANLKSPKTGAVEEFVRARRVNMSAQQDKISIKSDAYSIDRGGHISWTYQR